MTKIKGPSSQESKPSKKTNIQYSQNFLKDPKLVQHLIDMASISPDDTVIEIGGGTGIITAKLAERARIVRTVELDPPLAEQLRKRFAGNDHVEVIEGDFLKLSLPRQERYKIFGNIPFFFNSRHS